MMKIRKCFGVRSAALLPTHLMHYGHEKYVLYYFQPLLLLSRLIPMEVLAMNARNRQLVSIIRKTVREPGKILILLLF